MTFMFRYVWATMFSCSHVCIFYSQNYKSTFKLCYLSMLLIYCIQLVLLNVVAISSTILNTIISFNMYFHVISHDHNILRNRNIKCHSAVIEIVEHINVFIFKEYKSQESKAHFLSERLNINHVRGTRKIR